MEDDVIAPRPRATRHVRVVAALIWRDGRILVQQRPAGGPQPLLWEFPGGKVEPGESDAVALNRECVEEIGAPVRVGALAWHTEHAYEEITVNLHLYHAEIAAAAAPRPLQARRIQWLRPSELSGMAFCHADMPVVDDLRTGRLRPEFLPC